MSAAGTAGPDQPAPPPPTGSSGGATATATATRPDQSPAASGSTLDEGAGHPAAPPPAPGPGSRRRRSRRLIAVVVIVVVVAAVVAVVAVSRRSSGDTAASSAGAVATATAKVQRRTLTKTTTVDGNLGYADARPVVNQHAGTLTSVPSSGTVVDRGGELYRIDTAPVLLMLGDTPAYRTLDTSSTAGPDVRELEENLVALGYGGAITVDDTFDAATAYQLSLWQAKVGLEADGVLTLGEVVFLPTPVRLGDPTVTIGSNVATGAQPVKATGTTKVVTANLDASAAAVVKVGADVTITLPNGRNTPGKVDRVGAPVATSSGSGGGGAGQGGAAAAGSSASSSNQATISLTDPAAAAAFDSGAVKVKVVQDRRENVLAAPVTALLSLAEGGYAVEVVDGSTSTGSSKASAHLVAVQLGLVADDQVEITGKISDGTTVVVPAP